MSVWHNTASLPVHERINLPAGSEAADQQEHHRNAMFMKDANRLGISTWIQSVQKENKMVSMFSKLFLKNPFEHALV